MSDWSWSTTSAAWLQQAYCRSAPRNLNPWPKRMARAMVSKPWVKMKSAGCGLTVGSVPTGYASMEILGCTSYPPQSHQFTPQSRLMEHYNDRIMVIYKKGDLFGEQVEAFVNPVNCVGVMGGGLALQFKHRFPANFVA